MFDPKAKKVIKSTIINGVEIKTGDRVRYIGSSPCFKNKCGLLTKIKREWHSARSISRAGLVDEPHYSISAFVLWDDLSNNGPQSCLAEEIVLES